MPRISGTRVTHRGSMALSTLPKCSLLGLKGQCYMMHLKHIYEEETTTQKMGRCKVPIDVRMVTRWGVSTT
jgi:hypothetical protein